MSTLVGTLKDALQTKALLWLNCICTLLIPTPCQSLEIIPSCQVFRQLRLEINASLKLRIEGTSINMLIIQPKLKKGSKAGINPVSRSRCYGLKPMANSRKEVIFFFI